MAIILPTQSDRALSGKTNPLAPQKEAGFEPAYRGPKPQACMKRRHMLWYASHTAVTENHWQRRFHIPIVPHLLPLVIKKTSRRGSFLQKNVL